MKSGMHVVKHNPQQHSVQRAVERRRRFAGLAGLVPNSKAFELVLEHRLDEDRFKFLQLYTRIYISSCLTGSRNLLSEEAIVERLSDRQAEVPNKTPNGILLPKSELSLETNLLHQCFASVIADLGFAHLMDAWQLPIHVRIVSGQSDAATLARPYSTSKPHTDIWAGEPADVVLCNLPVLGDIDRTTMVWLEPPLDLGESYLRPLHDYQDGEDVARQSKTLDLTAKLGHLYISDGGSLHQTITKGGQCRISLDMRVRWSASAAEKAQCEKNCKKKYLANYVPFEVWRSVGWDTLLVSDETMDECRANWAGQQSGSARLSSLPTYRLVKFL